MTKDTNVKCSVSNCHFWGEGNKCRAEAIAIDIDAHASRWLEEYADELGGSHQDCAATSSVTCCQTFRPKSNSNC